MRLSIFGIGYVGAVSSGCLAEIGHEIVGVDVSADKRSELFEALALDGRGVGVAVFATRDIECELGRRRVPRVRALLAQHGEDIAEHVAEGVGRHGTNLEGQPSVTFVEWTVVLFA